MTTLTLARTVSETLANVSAHGGSTLSAVAGVSAPTTGYVVALPGLERIVPDPQEWETVTAEYARKNAAILAQPRHYLGAWAHKGNLYLDVSEVFSDLASAVAAGKARDQIAIWSLADSAEIATR